MDIIYFRFTNQRTTRSVFSEFQNETNISQIITHGIVEHWYVSLCAVILIFILYKLYRKPADVEKKKYSTRANLLYYLSNTLLMAALIYTAVIGMRGGAGASIRPITLSNANEYVNKSTETAIVLNTPFCFIRTFNKKVYKNPHYFKNEEVLEALYSPLHYPKPAEEFKPLNVVIIILESFGKEYSGFFNKDLDNGTYKGYTPFLDSLYAEGLTFKYSYANGRKSIDAMPSILSGIPMFIEPFISTHYSTNQISGIADILKEKGYYSAFFHGAPNGSMGFSAYANVARFDEYFGMSEYPRAKDDYNGWWGIWDEEFLQFYAGKMAEMKQPFVTSVFTLTSHHPFWLPERYEGQFPKGTQAIHQCIGYTDYALRLFFQKIAQQDWYSNTLFVITADHTNQIAHDEYYTDANLYAVPILFYQPGSNLKGLIETMPVQQMDITPSILGYLNYDKPYFAFGQDIFNTNEADKFAVNYNNQLYQFYQQDYFMQFDGQEVKSVYNYKTDILLHNNLAGKVKEQDEMETKLKAIIQQYIERMVDNKLTVTAKEK
ncbi:sulfatase [Bacteroidia bacterium]|nr:sulfatase [Bacteroidia bacterium]